MDSLLKKIIRKFASFARYAPEGSKGIEKLGHRKYVGGNWEEIGNLQFDFLKSKGMHPGSFLLDIACGSLRLGIKAIPFLKTAHYLGIEKERDLVNAGLEKELEHGLKEEKQPNIIISDSFEFEKLDQKANFAIAQSLFSHLPPNMINSCFQKLFPCLADDGTFYATYFRVDHKIQNSKKPHDHRCFYYTQDEMISFGETNGFKANYIGHWNHPKGQVMVEYRKC